MMYDIKQLSLYFNIIFYNFGIDFFRILKINQREKKSSEN